MPLVYAIKSQNIEAFIQVRDHLLIRHPQNRRRSLSSLLTSSAFLPEDLKDQRMLCLKKKNLVIIPEVKTNKLKTAKIPSSKGSPSALKISSDSEIDCPKLNCPNLPLKTAEPG